MSGYDIKKRVNAVLSIITNASYGTLYPTLHKLLAEHAVDMREISQAGRPSRKEYRITDQGRQELFDWLKRPASADQVSREFLLKLYLAQGLTAEELCGLLAARRGELERLKKLLQAAKGEVARPQEKWVVDYALALRNAEVEWLKQIETWVAQAEPGDNPPQIVKQTTA